MQNGPAQGTITALNSGLNSSKTPARSLGDNIGSDEWLEAKKKRDEAKKYS